MWEGAGGLQTLKPLLHQTWMPPLWDGAQSRQLVQFSFRTVSTASVTTLRGSSLTSLQVILRDVLRCQSDLSKQKPKYVTSLLKILKWFPMEDVFFKLLFLVSKPFLQTTNLNVKQKWSPAVPEAIAMADAHAPCPSWLSTQSPQASGPLPFTLGENYPKCMYVRWFQGIHFQILAFHIYSFLNELPKNNLVLAQTSCFKKESHVPRSCQS